MMARAGADVRFWDKADIEIAPNDSAKWCGYG